MGIKNILRSRVIKAEVKAVNGQAIAGQLTIKQTGLDISEALLSYTSQAFLPWEDVFSLEWDTQTANLQINFLLLSTSAETASLPAKQLRITLDDSAAKRSDLQAFLRSAHEYLQHSIVVSISHEITGGQVVIGSVRRSRAGLVLRFYSDDPVPADQQTRRELACLAAQIRDCAGL